MTPVFRLFLLPVMEHLELVAKNTTRKNQLALVKCLGNILKNWSPPPDIATSGESHSFCEAVRIFWHRTK